jgi:hypothetical protein
MNEIMANLYGKIVEKTGKSNRQREIINLIQEVTLEEHKSRRYLKDKKEVVWSAEDLQSYSNPFRPVPNPNCCEVVIQDNLQCNMNELNSIEFNLPQDADRGFESLTIVTETFEDTFASTELKNKMLDVMKAKKGDYPETGIAVALVGGAVKLESESPVQFISLSYFGLPDVSIEGYDSWIGQHPYDPLIINEVSARIASSIGAHDASTLFNLAERFRRHVRIDNLHERVKY